MNRKRPPQEVVSKLCNRSSCNVQVGAVLVDRHGRIFAGQWNHAGPDGLGRHAEEEAIRHANPRRLPGAHLVVIAKRRKNNRWVSSSRPCEARCLLLARKHGIASIEYITKSGEWKIELL